MLLLGQLCDFPPKTVFWGPWEASPKVYGGLNPAQLSCEDEQAEPSQFAMKRAQIWSPPKEKLGFKLPNVAKPQASLSTDAGSWEKHPRCLESSFLAVLQAKSPTEMLPGWSLGSFASSNG